MRTLFQSFDKLNMSNHTRIEKLHHQNDRYGFIKFYVNVFLSVQKRLNKFQFYRHLFALFNIRIDINSSCLIGTINCKTICQNIYLVQHVLPNCQRYLILYYTSAMSGFTHKVRSKMKLIFPIKKWNVWLFLNNHNRFVGMGNIYRSS